MIPQNRRGFRQISASIVPPPFGSGYEVFEGNQGRNGLLQSCRPLSGAVICLIAFWGFSLSSRFNRAAPFRERLSALTETAGRAVTLLQSCRPLSGAVICRRCTMPLRRSCFNRAAPFRERLSNTATEFAVTSPFCAFLRNFGPHFLITTSGLCQANPIRKRGALREVPVGLVHHRTSRITRKQRSAVSDRRGRHKIALLPFGHPLTSVHRRDAQGCQLFQPRRIPPELLQPQN